MRTQVALGVTILLYNVATAMIGYTESQNKGVDKVNDGVFSMLVGINPLLAIIWRRILGKRVKVWKLFTEDIFLCNLWITGVIVMFISQLMKGKKQLGN